jgi:hypothetical protein
MGREPIKAVARAGADGSGGRTLFGQLRPRKAGGSAKIFMLGAKRPPMTSLTRTAVHSLPVMTRWRLL